MKLTHAYSKFNFIDEETNDKYDVICVASSWHNNTFKIYKNGNYIITYHPRGGHVNKTRAKQFILETTNNL